MKLKATIIDIICLFYILLFVYAAVSKLLDFETFRVQLGQSPMLTNFKGLVAYGVPSIELALALLLIVKKFRIPALYASLGLMMAFSMYIIAILNFSDHIPCSCGGVLEQLGWTEHLVFNIVFMFLAVIAIILESNNISTIHEKNIKQYIKT
ncbi:Methylamine utilisation protein MauE [Zhouia amylolytica]|uniref:Methylamine utilisation protein MauE domain-containing protein n=2 Tax=Zhouia amylolytica TaxID=376730 RepID=W2UPC8_9FLAO|nr:MauE/DoxX family redox-associated membrane protein [Zhouia amylolytica]ETN95779.1 hypothetical protein P278_15010 [Zhouia amylolytica AD3]MCQ0112063.1 hypothetical protein [Zhouia amylolytica]SFS55363.1 Methylamine utilisation protein MauE [Zhouia amylolytica]